MPETSMHEDYPPKSWENQIRRARQVVAMKAKAEPKPMNQTAHPHFGGGVPALDARHASTSLTG